MGSVFFGEGGARSFRFFYKPEGVGLFELPAEGRSFAFIFQYHEEGGAGACHQDGAGKGVKGAGGFPEDGVQREKGRFKIIGQGGKEKGKVSCLKGFDAAAGIVFQALWKGVDGGVGSGGGFRGLGADDEEALILLLPRLVSAQTEGELRVQRGGTCERPVMAMNRDSLGLDTLRRIDTVGNDLMALRGAGREGNVILEVAGFGITLGRAPEPEYADVVTRSGRVKLYLFNCGEFGFSQLVGVDYDGYAPEEKGFLDQKLGSSIHVAASVLQVQVALNRNRTFYFATDLNFAVDNYRLSDAHIRLGYEHGRLLPVALDEPADKSKFVTSSLGIPLRLIYKPFRNFQVSAIAYSDFGIELTSLHKKPKVQYELSGLRTYQFGVGGAVSYSGVGVFVRYGVTPLFKKGGGPECHTLSFGISLLM